MGFMWFYNYIILELGGMFLILVVIVIDLFNSYFLFVLLIEFKFSYCGEVFSWLCVV